MKKKIIVSLLIISFLNYLGCESIYVTYDSLSEDEINTGRPLPDEKIRLILNDGSKIECFPVSDFIKDTLYYLKVTTRDTYIMGLGQKINLSDGAVSEFNGVIKGDEIDSTNLLMNNAQGDFAVWVKGNKNECILFKDGNFAIIQPEQGSGYFIWRPNQNIRKIDFNDIKEIYGSSPKSYIYGPLIVVGVAAMVAMGIAFYEISTMWK